jgi:hypothetical protein
MLSGIWVSKKSFFAKVHFIAGKGGVGKTVISQCLAALLAKQNKTLLVELSEEEIGEDEEKFSIIEQKSDIAKNLFYVKIFPDQALYEYLCLKIPTKKILDSLFSQKLFRTLCSAMPGLSDLTRLGKIWFHADKQHVDHQEIFDKIVVDLPSSGFTKRFLSIAKVVHQAVKVGPLAKEAKLIHEYFFDKNNARLHLVCLPQELVINETIDLVKQMQYSSCINLGYLFINRFLKLKSKHLLTNSYPLKNYPETKKILDAYAARLQEEDLQINRLEQLENSPEIITLGDQLGEMLEPNIVKNMVIELSDLIYE